MRNKIVFSRFTFAINNILSKSKRSQVTIFIILGLIIVVGFLIVLFLFNPPEIKLVDENNPQAFIESCTRESVEESISLLSKRGGDINPIGYISYDGDNIAYLCYNEEFYESCVNQRPLLVEHIEKEITNYITPIIAECFYDLKSKLEKRYDVEESQIIVKTKLEPEYVSVIINKNFKTIRKEEVREFSEFRMNLVHPIYEFAKISMEIVNQEIRYCNFDELGFNILHPKYDVRKFITGDSDIIYNIKDVETGEQFKFAVKSCTLPVGF
ncbi:MAG: hypothetical protein AABW83_02980 [Nanoarchaeota archaeon]